MEVPFLSSSAISRAHYNLVQKVETAFSQQVDDFLFQEVETLQRWLGKHRPTSSECVEYLVLLLYCATVTLGRITHSMLEFALPHAVTLAEAGSTTNQKRIGYLFCNEIMRQDDELQIMLVNTLRKDLEDSTVTRICLALDALIVHCSEDAVPAVMPRLIDLLAHNSSHVKRKAMAVIRLISLRYPDILSHAKDKVRLRLRDSDSDVVAAALRLLGALMQSRVVQPKESLDLALEAHAPENSASNRARIKLAEFFGAFAKGLQHDNSKSLTASRAIETLHQMLAAAKDEDTALALEIFRALSNYPTEDLVQYFSSRGAITKSILGRLLVSPKPNTQYFCLVCLLALDPSLWAGTTNLIPSAFDESQVHVIMGLLDSPDRIIRTKTLQVLYRVDPQILSIHLSQLGSAFQTSSSSERDPIAERILEISAQFDADGEAYASRLKEISIGLKDRHKHDMKGKGKVADGGAGLVSESLVEQVLLHLRTRPTEFCRAFVDTTARIPVSDAGPTLTLIIAASVCEYGALSSIPQEDLLRGLASRLDANPPAIQEALLLAMLRVAARCSSDLGDIKDQVQILHKVSRRHIRYRCEQYLSYSSDMTSLKNIVATAESDTLPDFTYALGKAETRPQASSQSQQRSPNAAPRFQVATGKLRYEAYDPPRPAPKLIRRPSSTASVNSYATSSRSGRSDSISSSHSQSQNRRDRANTAFTDPDDPDDPLSRTLTAGDLALAVHETKFVGSSSIPKTSSQSLARAEDGNRSTSRSPMGDLTDLIALDSPFLADPNEESEELVSFDFQGAWDALKHHPTSRGWCESRPAQVKSRIDTLPNHHITATLAEGQENIDSGESILVISRPVAGQQADIRGSLRLRPGEEESTLWQLRCVDSTIRAELRKLLDDT